MKRLSQLALIVVLIFKPGFAGEYADAFLLASLYPQVQSMGNSTVAAKLVNGHALNNPAGYAQGSSSRFSLVYEQFASLSTNYGFELAYPIGDKYNLGLTVIHNSIDDLYFRPNLSGLPPDARRDSVLLLADSQNDLIQYREDAVFLSLAREFEFILNLGWKFFKIPFRVPLGISVKYLDKLLVENRGLGSGIDIGGQLFFDLTGFNDIFANTEFSTGLFVSDILNTPVYWDTEHQDAIKRNWSTGFSITQLLPQYATAITISSGTQTRYVDVRQYGVEISIKDMVFIRGGHDGYSPSFGLGIGLKKFIIGYTFSQHELADMQKIGINYHF
ncbi:MAG: hypothetical protein U9Q77_08370 [Candidatus Marinimicrobia bacterium]|nr:hypothetical protein [Candidatus Neomarinimicrobiota bacterium]